MAGNSIVGPTNARRDRELRQIGMKQLALCLTLILSACGDGGGTGSPDASQMDAAMSNDAPLIDAPAQTFPAVCDESPLLCPDAASLASCEAGSGSAFGTCSYLPITEGCVTAGCPSDAQICRTAESAAGHCTHSCVDDADCVVMGGGSATCTTINGAVKICIVN